MTRYHCLLTARPNLGAGGSIQWSCWTAASNAGTETIYQEKSLCADQPNCH